MHAVFMIYGIKDQVDLFTRELQSQKFQWVMKNPKNNKTDFIYVQGSLRLLPFGVYEYVFPKEHLNHVLTALNFDKPTNYTNNYGLKYKFVLSLIRKMLALEKIPKFDTSQEMVWLFKNNVSIIPLGVRYDEDMIENQLGQYKGWIHEAL